MPASFPNAKKTFSAVVNGVTKLVAALFNSPYDEIEAIETFIGPTGGGAQSYYTSISDMLINYRMGCNAEYKGDADLYVRAGEIMITDASGNKRLRRNASDLTVTWSDIDTGSEANSTQYYVYACADNNSTTFTVKISTNASAPSGATYYRKIGSFFNNSSGHIEGMTDLISKVYESNWFAVSVATTYTKNHYIGTNKILIDVYFSSNSNGSDCWKIFNTTHTSSAEYTAGCVVDNIGSSSVEIKTGQQCVSGQNPYPNDDGALWGGEEKYSTRQTSGYYKIIIKAIY